jgi:hypothetical protein
MKGSAVDLRAGVAVGVLLLLPASAEAQPQGPPPLSLICAEFHKNVDGSWSPTHKTSLTKGRVTRTFGPKTRFGPATRFQGAPIAKLLNQQCARR